LACVEFERQDVIYRKGTLIAKWRSGYPIMTVAVASSGLAICAKQNNWRESGYKLKTCHTYFLQYTDTVVSEYVCATTSANTDIDTNFIKTDSGEFPMQ